MKEFGGKIVALDRNDINTDEIIPAKYLTEIEKDALKAHLLEDLKLDGFDAQGETLKAARVVLTRGNFGCGSSREHAPWAFEVNGKNAIIAEGFARIFRQNMLNCGMLPVELPKADIAELMALAKTGMAVAAFDLDQQKLTVSANGDSKTCAFKLDSFALDLIRAGGWVQYANGKY